MGRSTAGPSGSSAAMSEQAFLSSALSAIQAQQGIIEQCSSGILRAMQRNAKAFDEMQRSITTLNEMVAAVQAIARHPSTISGGKRRMWPVVEIPVSSSSKRSSIADAGHGAVSSRRMKGKGKGKARAIEISPGSSRKAVSADLGRSDRSETPVVQARKKRKAVDLGFGDRPLYPPSFFASPVRVRDPMDTIDLVSDVESLPPPSSIGEEDTDDREADEERERSPSEAVRGREDLSAPEYLAMSDREKSAVVWPKKGKNTHVGRLQQISCDLCQAVFHWACGGFEDTDKPSDKSWSCPECDDMVRSHRHRQIQPAQRERCNRHDCIMRAFKSFRKPGDDDQFLIDRIIGRKMVKRDNKAKRVYDYLVLWDGWPIYDCTWERAKNIPSLEQYEADFLAECESEGVNTLGTVVLPLACREWNEKGLRRRKMLMEEGVMPAEWWEGDDDPVE